MIEYVIAGAILILGGALQIWLRRSDTQVPGSGRWAGLLGYAAVVLGLVLLLAGITGVGAG
ncbi:MAG: hypothetical protein M5U22_01055 [Thermoleophilia bacterium]|nr:hypothetical protein [Thermoleophilia bacterium]